MTAANGRRRRSRGRVDHYGALFESILSDMRDEDLEEDVIAFHHQYLPKIDCDRLLRAARIAKNSNTYEDICHDRMRPVGGLVILSDEEKEALVKEKESAIPESGMWIVILTISLAAFLQGQVQSSFNTSSLFQDVLDISNRSAAEVANEGFKLIGRPELQSSDWILGAINSTPFLVAALLGCSIALPLSDRLGRKGSMQVAAVLVLITSLLMGAIPSMQNTVPRWRIVLALRIFNGLGMGIKAVNAPMLASECAVGYWRGTSILAWQLWVACGIMVGFTLNLVFVQAPSAKLQLMLILGAPALPALMLCIVSLVCPESPRFYLKHRNYRPAKAYDILKSLRGQEVIALRDIYILHKSIQGEWKELDLDPLTYGDSSRRKGLSFIDIVVQIKTLFTKPRLRNALISSCIVALSQQLCGINILAFYSGTLFNHLGQTVNKSLVYSIVFGAINFGFGLVAIKYIDLIGRRKWLVTTLVPMAILLAGASGVSAWALGSDSTNTAPTILVAVFLYMHTAVYSPGLGPVPFTFAAESFPLTHREAGCSIAVAINLFFAGLLGLFFPLILSKLNYPGCFALFSGFSLVAFLLVFLFVEETKQFSLEQLDRVFGKNKTAFTHFQVFTYTPWAFREFLPWYFTDYLPSILETNVSIRSEAVKRALDSKPEQPNFFDRVPADEVMA